MQYGDLFADTGTAMAITAGMTVDLPTTTIGVTGVTEATGVVAAAAAADAGVPGPEPFGRKCLEARQMIIHERRRIWWMCK